MSTPAVITKDCPAWAWSELEKRGKPPVINLTRGQPIRFLHLCAEQDGYAGYALCLTPSGQIVVVASHNLDHIML